MKAHLNRQYDEKKAQKAELKRGILRIERKGAVRTKGVAETRPVNRSETQAHTAKG